MLSQPRSSKLKNGWRGLAQSRRPQVLSSSTSLAALPLLRRHFTYDSPKQARLSLGMRREDPSRIWERRAPLTPHAVSTLVESEGVDVVVQACERRVFSNAEYEAAGARIQDKLTDQSIVIGIKEVPLSELDTSPVNGRPRTHVMFSHTAKGQPYNLPLLGRFLESPTSPRLIDYELLTGGNGKRTVAFGYFAGSAGVIEGLQASALDLLEIGIASPFLHLPRPFAHRDLGSVKGSLRLVGEYIAARGMPRAVGPFVVTVTGSGNVSQGALDMLAELPVTFVSPAQLPALVSDPHTDLRRVYVVHALPQSYVSSIDGKTPYSRAEYYANPSLFESRFAETIAPYTSLLINGAGWQPGFPRLMSNEQLVTAIRKAEQVGRARFRSIADVSCDVEGGLEFVSRSTTISEPSFVARPASHPQNLRGVQVMSVDILPTEIPFDSSVHFSQKLMPYLRALIHSEQNRADPESEGQYLEALDRATIAKGGELKQQHGWLYDLLSAAKSAGSSPVSSSTSSSSTSTTTTTAPSLQAKKKVLLFGSGMVAKPFCETIWSRNADVELIVASNNLREAEALVRGNEDYTTVVGVNIGSSTAEEKMSQLVKSADVVVSLLPAGLHPQIAELCLDHSKHLVTASYISPAMRALHDRAVESDVLFLNEIGLDPGIDHMSAMEMRDRLESEGKRVVSFISWCGGLPAPEDSNVPLGMKFSWSPKALMSAALNDAKYKMSGKMHDIPGTRLLASHFPHVPIAPGFALEGLANRNSLPYAQSYNLGPLDGLETVFRGTLRYKGFAELLSAMANQGLLNTNEKDKIVLKSWNELGSRVGQDASVAGLTRDVEDNLVALSILPGGPTNDLPALPTVPHTPFDLLSMLLAHKLRYHPGERDMVILSHEIITESTLPSSSSQREVHTSSLITYGDLETGNSAMARTVGLPLASAALLILDNRVRARGVHSPVESEIYRPVLEELAGRHGITMKETTRVGGGMAKSLARR
ncbi:hypothetical protein DL93DRAFT_2130912 [Clavulina sp. PMI_390]|nr:hypothetical protein DL93DRAFT_2130912 [Clavulina sp. PMI_390]